MRPPLARRSSVDRLGRLTFEGGRLRRANGEAVTLRGSSLFWSQWMGSFFNPDLVVWLADDWLIDVIRVPVGVSPDGYLINPKIEERKARAVIEASIDRGIFVILDWHAHVAHTAEAARLFGSVAKAYGNSPNIFYETWNEPHRRYSWDSDIAPHHVQLIDQVREHAPDAPVILGTPEFCLRPDAAAAAPVNRPNVAYSFHFYAATHREGLRSRVRAAVEAGLSLFVTEWGMGDATGDGFLDIKEAERWLAFLNSWQIGHVNWSICDKPEACSALRQGAAPTGRWRRSDLSRSGRFLRSYLRGAVRQAAI